MLSMRLSAVAVLALLVCACAPVTAVDWSQLNETSIDAVDPADFLTLTAEQLDTVNPAACAGIREEQLRNTGVSGNSSACAGMPQWCMISLTPTAIPGLQAECLRAIPAARFDISSVAIPALPPSLVAEISPAQFHHITIGSIELLSASQLSHLSLPVCSAMWDVTLNMFEDGTAVQSPPACSGLTAACVEALPPASLDAVHGLCLSHLQPAVLSSLSGNQSRVIPSDALSWLPPSAAAALSASFCAGLSGNALDWMGSANGLRPLVGVTPQCFGAITAQACRESDADWLQLFEAPANATRLSALSADCVRSFGCDVWSSLQTGNLSNVRAALNRDGSAALTARCADPNYGGTGSQNHLDLKLALGLGGGAIIFTAAALSLLYVRKRNRAKQQQQQNVHAHLLAQQSQGAYRTMP
jgi:hypothetical protein